MYMNTIAKLLVCGVMSAAMSSAWAWGDREQGILGGLAGAWLLGRVLQAPHDSQPLPPPVVVQPQPPVYVYPSSPPQVYYYGPTCYNIPQHDHWGRITHYRTICR